MESSAILVSNLVSPGRFINGMWMYFVGVDPSKINPYGAPSSCLNKGVEPISVNRHIVLHGDDPWVGSTPRFSVAALLHSLALQLKPSLPG